MLPNRWAYDVRDALALARDLRRGRIIGVQSTLVSVDSTLRSILDPGACERRGAAAVLRLDVAELGDAIEWAAPAEATRLRALSARLERFAVRLSGADLPLAA
jgi:hypothetical protein